MKAKLGMVSITCALAFLGSCLEFQPTILWVVLPLRTSVLTRQDHVSDIHSWICYKKALLDYVSIEFVHDNNNVAGYVLYEAINNPIGIPIVSSLRQKRNLFYALLSRWLAH